jgi:heterodisulfide reductase subunit D
LIIELAREQVIKEHRTPPGVVELLQNIASTSNVYGEPAANRFAKVSSTPQQIQIRDQVVYFVGCTTAFRHPEIANATGKFLSRLGVKIDFLDSDTREVCCGSPLIRAGAISEARELAKQNVEAIKQSKLQTVITTCPGCARTLRNDYPTLGTPLPKNVRVLHVTEYLSKYHTELKGLFTTPLNPSQKADRLKVSYHDPCHLGRELEVYEQPRKLLQLLPNVDLIELHHNREFADCCGGGGALPKTFPNLALEVGQHRLAAAHHLNLDFLVSCCPNCKQHFMLSSKELNPPIKAKPLDLMELLARATD